MPLFPPRRTRINRLLRSGACLGIAAATCGSGAAFTGPIPRQQQQQLPQQQQICHASPFLTARTTIHSDASVLSPKKSRTRSNRATGTGSSPLSLFALKQRETTTTAKAAAATKNTATAKDASSSSSSTTTTKNLLHSLWEDSMHHSGSAAEKASHKRGAISVDTPHKDKIEYLSKLFQNEPTNSNSMIISGSKTKSTTTTTSGRSVEPANENTPNQNFDWEQLLLPAGAVTLLGGGVTFTAHSLGITTSDIATAVENLMADPQSLLQSVVDAVEAMGPMGKVYFAAFYLIAELLAVPATPLTLAAGSLFGLTQGVATVLIPATIAACIAFVIGKTFLRSWVEDVVAENPKFQKLDRAIGERGFKLLVLVRLSPLFPFALSNYVYGASSIAFPAYFWGTLLGFLPGTIGYVYTGIVGKELVLGGGDASQPWYIYAAGLAALTGFLKVVTDVASEIVEAIDDEPTGSV
jgi:uncharacterized membrane protein YdjX (TVP38/TMEM64 family)